MDKWNLDEIRRHLEEGLPILRLFNIEVVEATPERSCIRLNPGEHARRPGGSINGPVQFTLADCATYALILAACGDASAATVDLTINFLRPALKFPLIAEALPLRAGRRLFTADVRIVEEETKRLVAQAVSTYALSDGSGSREPRRPLPK
jgi:uncharacterized protein (TIGR00369 family)